MKRKQFFSMVFVFVLLICCLGYAEESKAGEGAAASMWRYDDQPIEKDVEMAQFKSALFEKGFYSSIIGSNTDILNSSELDIQTKLAVKKLCELNDLEYYSDGVSYDVWWRVSLEPDSLISPATGEYRLITYMSQDSGADTTIQDIQNRFVQLGYNGDSFTRGLYDSNLQDVVYQFADWENFAYSEDSAGIPVEMQQLLFSDSAKMYEQKSTSLAEHFNGFLLAKTSIFGLLIPNIALGIAGIFLICLIVLLILQLAKPAEPSKAKPSESTSPKRRGRRKNSAPREVVFTVSYEDQKCVHVCDLKTEKCIRIGRSTGSFPLIAEDSSISRKHCEIYCEGKNLYLHDFSTYGTKIGGQMCKHEKHILQDGDVIQMGKHVITVNY